MRCIVAIDLALMLLVLLIILVIVVLMPNLPENVTNDKMCVAHSSDPDLLCGPRLDVLADFMEREMEESFKRTSKEVKEHFEGRRISLKYYVDNQYWEMKPAARFTGELYLDTNKTNNDRNKTMTTIKAWKFGRDIFDNGGFKRYGVSMKNGRIVIPVSGTYFIYSFLDLFQKFVKFHGEPGFVNKNGSIRHSMFKYDYHNKEEVELMRSFTPQIMSENGRFSSYSSYMSGLVNLKAGEEISVKCSNTHLLRHSYNNFMGLNLV